MSAVSALGTPRASSLPAPVRSERLVGPFLVFVVMIAATIPWRSKTYYEGGFDAVVVAKAVLSLVALAWAALLGRGRGRRPLPAAPAVFLTAYLVVTVLGGWAAGAAAAALVIAVRVVILALTVLILASRFDASRLVGCLIFALASYALLGALTGLGSLASGRLAGAFPRLHPNDLASACALVILWCLWKIIVGEDRLFDIAALAVASAVLLATGSRTPLLALSISGLLLIVRIRALRVRTIMIGLALIPAALWVFTQTGAVQQLLLRNQASAQISTLSNRTIAWQAALGPKSSPWLEWLGAGLSTKQVQVPGQWWNQQILDSSWISALVQAGLIGLAICLGWIVYSLIRTADSPPRFRALQQAIIVYLAVRGVLESGLFDATTAFLVLFVTVLATPVAAVEGLRGRAALLDDGLVTTS